MRSFIKISIFFSALFFGVTSSAETNPAMGGGLAGRMMQRMDHNKDNIVTRDEARKAAEKNFRQADKTKDGQLSDADLRAYVDSRYNLVDADKDDAVSKEEYLSATAPFARLDAPGNELSDDKFASVLATTFKCLDRNGDGKLTGYEQPVQGLFGDAKVPGDGPVTLPPASGLDGDRNGTLSETEWTKSFLDKFDLTDRNSDGQVTPEEMRGFTKTPDSKACGAE